MFMDKRPSSLLTAPPPSSGIDTATSDNAPRSSAVTRPLITAAWAIAAAGVSSKANAPNRNLNRITPPVCRSRTGVPTRREVDHDAANDTLLEWEILSAASAPDFSSREMLTNASRDCQEIPPTKAHCRVTEALGE